MLGSVSLEVAIGLVMTFSLFSVMMTSVREAIESILKSRAKMLEQIVGELFKGGAPDAVAAFYNSPVINPLFKGDYKSGGRNLPSYIPSANFAVAVAGLAQSTAKLPDAVQQMVQRLADPALHQAATVQSELEAWYDSAMDRLSGSYKRQTQIVLFGVALLVAAVGNVNPILIGDRLAVDQELRANIAALTPDATQSADGADASSAIAASIKQQMDIGGLPIGWSPGTVGLLFPQQDAPHIVAGVLKCLFGWLIAAFAAMLGAPFWFDILNKLVNLRAALKPEPPADSPPKPMTVAAAVPLDGSSTPVSNDEEHGDAC